MKKISILLFFGVGIAWQQVQAQLPTLTDTLEAPCGEHFDYEHDQTGNSDPVGFRIKTELPCLPYAIKLRHGTYWVPDIIQTWVHGPNGWIKLDDSSWHGWVYQNYLTIPSWADDVMFVSHNNLDKFTAWYLELECFYLPVEECCKMAISLSGPTGVVCPSDSITITPIVSGGIQPMNFEWNTGSRDSVLSEIISSTTNFSLVVTDRFGCTVTGEFFVNVPPAPVSFADTLVCPGSPISLPAYSGLAWQQDTTIIVKSDFVAWGVIPDTFGCEHWVPYKIWVQKQGYVSSDTTVCRGQYIQLKADGVGVSWNTDDFVKIISDTSFFVEIHDTLGCVWFDTVSIESVWCIDSANIYAPNVMKPDDPSNWENCCFGVFINPEAQKDIFPKLLRIWDRWGNEAFQAKSLEIYWDGFYEKAQTPAPAGVYVWQLFFDTPEGEKSLAGNVTLIR